MSASSGKSGSWTLFAVIVGPALVALGLAAFYPQAFRGVLGVKTPVEEKTLNIQPPSAPIRVSVLDNEGTETLVLTEYCEHPFMAAISKARQLGVAAVNTEIKVLERRATQVPTFELVKVEILEGEHRGKTGWVSAKTIKTMEMPR